MMGISQGSAMNPARLFAASAGRLLQPEVDRLIERQSSEGDPEKRKPLLWAIERKLAEDDARPIIFYAPTGACWRKTGERSGAGWGNISDAAPCLAWSGTPSRESVRC